MNDALGKAQSAADEARNMQGCTNKDGSGDGDPIKAGKYNEDSGDQSAQSGGVGGHLTPS